MSFKIEVTEIDDDSGKQVSRYEHCVPDLDVKDIIDLLRKKTGKPMMPIAEVNAVIDLVTKELASKDLASK